MAKKNRLMTPEERAQHEFAVKIRKMTDKQIYDLVNASEPPEQTQSEVIRDFIALCATKGRRMGPSAICSMKMVAREAGYDIGV